MPTRKKICSSLDNLPTIKIIPHWWLFASFVSWQPDTGHAQTRSRGPNLITSHKLKPLRGGRSIMLVECPLAWSWRRNSFFVIVMSGSSRKYRCKGRSWTERHRSKYCFVQIFTAEEIIVSELLRWPIDMFKFPWDYQGHCSQTVNLRLTMHRRSTTSDFVIN